MREPPFRAPWPVVAVVAAILGAYLLQRLGGDPAWVYSRFGVSAAGLEAGRWSGLITALFVHGSWTHALVNAVAALAFGAPVARLFGSRAEGVLAFFGFYLACGALGSLGFALVSPGSTAVLVGASGAVSGLMGAASRLLGPQEGRLSPYAAPTVIGMAVGWLVVNLLLAVFGLGDIAAGAPIAWQAHLFGYAAGVFGVGPVAWLLGRTSAA